MAMDKQTIIALLAVFGEQHRGQPWPDYSGCGFTAADAPMLAALAGDVELSNEDADSNEVWIPLHAWRALQPLMPAGLQELLPALAVLDEDDWAASELPQVFAAAGETGIVPLQAYLQDESHTEFARGTVVEALAEIARCNDGLREPVMAVLVERLRVSTAADAWINGCIVSALIDLEAVEAIDVIRAAYALKKVDLSFCGHVEDVEMDMGLREQRVTPASDGWVLDDAADFPPPSLEPVPKHISGEEWEERVMQFLNFYGNEYSLETLTELHGFFVAIGCSPEPIHPAVWLPEIWGGEDYAPEFEDVQTLQVFLALIMPFYNSVMQELQTIDDFTIPFATGHFKGEAFTYFGDWCSGFIIGADIGGFPTRDIPGIIPFLDTLERVAESDLASLGMSDVEIMRKKRELNEAVRKIYRLGRGERVTLQPVVHDAPKAGRNDPCPCGSGKKYKKCCLH